MAKKSQKTRAQDGHPPQQDLHSSKSNGQRHAERDELERKVFDLEKKLADLQALHERTADELAKVQEERNMYHASLLKVLEKDLPETSEEEMIDIMKNAVPLKEFIFELEQSLREEG